MADLISDGYTRVTWVTTISNIAAPTTGELNGGVALESFITPDGLDITPSTASVDTSNVASTFSTNTVGRRGYEINVTMKNQGFSAAPWTTLPYGTVGYLAVRRNNLAGAAWASAQKVEIYPCTTGEAQINKPAANEVQKFTVPMMVTSDPAPRSAVA